MFLIESVGANGEVTNRVTVEDLEEVPAVKTKLLNSTGILSCIRVYALIEEL